MRMPSFSLFYFRPLYFTISSAIFLLSLQGLAQAATLNVPTSANPTIQAAIGHSVNGDTILIADGTYSGTGNINLDPAGKNLTITSQHGPASTIIECRLGGRGFYIHSGETNTVVSGLTIQDGTSGSNAGNDIGGAISIINTGTLTISNCNFSGNVAGSGGGAIYNSNSGTVIVSGCNFDDNETGGNGGGIYNSNTGGATSIANCTFIHNHTSSGSGGGIGNNIAGGTVSITNCTFTLNSARDAGAGIDNYFGGNGTTLTLTNDVAYNEVTENTLLFGLDVYLENGVLSGHGTGTQTVVINNCDIGDAGGRSINGNDGFYGSGTFSADPLFFNASVFNAPDDLHLKFGSPCIGAGTASGAPTTTLDGRNRPNPPSIGAYEMVPTSPTHLLWDNTSGAMSIWNYDILHGTSTQNTYGPYPGWTAKALADGGTDGLTRVLLGNLDGRMSLWSLNNGTGAFTQFTFGPYSGWTANAISVGSDNTTHVLWDNTNGLASIWNYSTANGNFTQNTYGPYAGWTAKAIADGPNGLLRVLWDNSDGRMSLWSLNNASSAFTQYTFGPYPGWTATGVSVAPDNTTHILWHNTDGRVSIWNYNTTSGTFTQNTYGAYPAWTAKSLADGSDGTLRVLWEHTSGLVSIWSLNNTTAANSQFSFGPFSGWNAFSISGD